MHVARIRGHRKKQNKNRYGTFRPSSVDVTEDATRVEIICVHAAIGASFAKMSITARGERGFPGLGTLVTRRLTYDSNHADLHADNFLPLNVRSAYLPRTGGKGE